MGFTEPKLLSHAILRDSPSEGSLPLGSLTALSPAHGIGGVSARAPGRGARVEARVRVGVAAGRGAPRERSPVPRRDLGCRARSSRRFAAVRTAGLARRPRLSSRSRREPRRVPLFLGAAVAPRLVLASRRAAGRVRARRVSRRGLRPPARARVHRPALAPAQPVLPRAARRELSGDARLGAVQPLVQVRHHVRLDARGDGADARRGEDDRGDVRRRALVALHEQLPAIVPERAHRSRGSRDALLAAPHGVLRVAGPEENGRPGLQERRYPERGVGRRLA